MCTIVFPVCFPISSYRKSAHRLYAPCLLVTKSSPPSGRAQENKKRDEKQGRADNLRRGQFCVNNSCKWPINEKGCLRLIGLSLAKRYFSSFCIRTLTISWTLYFMRVLTAEEQNAGSCYPGPRNADVRDTSLQNS